jgi:hypothetical protein
MSDKENQSNQSNQIDNKIEMGSKEKIKQFRKRLQNNLETCLRYLFFWESDDAKIGHFIRLLHQLFIMFLIVCYLVVHTFFPSYIFLFFVWLCVTIIWIGHVITGGCIFTRIEQKLTGEKITIVDPLLELFQIPVTRETTMGITMLTSTITVVFLTFELLLRTIINIKAFINNTEFNSIYPFIKEYIPYLNTI